jgi:starch synthase (maltosyl-transferring)
MTETKEFQAGPRIYNFFPRLVGPISKWYSHLDRIKQMDFNWIYFNPLSYSGFSGSLYAIKDYYKFNPIFAPENAADPYSWEPFKVIVKRCHELGIKVMYDLVINHTSIDSPLVKDHPEWFKEKLAVVHKQTNMIVKYLPLNEKPNEVEYPPESFSIQKRIANPCAIDPADARKITIWGDLAEIDNENSSDLNNLNKYWLELVEFYVDLGIDGFRCDAAYQVPSDIWSSLINAAKDKKEDLIFIAETLGCTLPQLESTVEAGFDYIFSSSKWWDFTAKWCVEQYNKYRNYAPSISFPENHDTTRINADSNGRIDVQIFRYLFSSFFSAGSQITFGYEYGFKKRIDVVNMMPNDIENPSYDISYQIKTINKFKRSLKCLNEDGLITEYKFWDSNILIIKKTSVDHKQQILLVYNKNWQENKYVKIDSLRTYLDLNKTIFSINIDRDAHALKNVNFEYNLAPNQYFLFLEE